MSVSSITYDVQVPFQAQSIPPKDDLSLYKHWLLNSIFQLKFTGTSIVKSEAVDRQPLWEQLFQIAVLQDDWDGYGAVRVCENCINNASSIILALPNSIPSPDLFPNSNGTVTLEWDTDNGLLSIELGKDSFSAFFDTKTVQKSEQNSFDGNPGLPPFVNMAFQLIFPQSQEPGYALNSMTGENDGSSYITSSCL